MASAVTSIYEYPISAASAAYAPTNTAEVTGMIDSAVSGKLDASASSAFITSTAGLATTAEVAEKLDSSASSAFITSTAGCQPSGDYVSSSELADYQTTAGMSGYASTADLADKLDSSASSAFITSTAGLVSTGDLSAYLETSSIELDSASAITGIAGTAIAGGGVVTATGTATAGDTAAPTTYVTSIDSMPLSAANDTVLTAEYRVTSYDPDLSATSTSTATGTATGFSVIHNTTGTGLPAKDSADTISSVKVDSTSLPLAANQLLAGAWQSGGLGSVNYPYFWLQYSPTNNAFPASACTGYLSPNQYATGAGVMMSAGYFRGMLKANELFLTRENAENVGTATKSINGYYIRAEAHNGRGAHLGLTAARVTGTSYTGDSSECWTSTGDISQSGVKFSYTATRESGVNVRDNYYAALTTGGIYLSANWPTASAKTGMQLLRSSLTFTSNDSSESGTGTASTVYANTGITFEDSASTATMEKSSIDFWNAKLDSSAIETDSASAITGIAGSAIAGGGGTEYSAGNYIQISGDEISVTGIDPDSYAQSSSLADYQTTAGMSAYASTSDLSAKLDSSASSAFVTSTAGCQPAGDYVSSSELADYQTTAGMSGYASTSDLSAKLDSSASSAFVTSTADCMPLSASGEYQTTAGMSAYASTADLSGKLDISSTDVALGSTAYAHDNSFAQGESVSATGYSFAQGQEASATSVSFAQGYDVTAGAISFVQGFKASANATAAVFGKYNKDGNGSGPSGIALAFGDGTARSSVHNLFEFRKNGTLTIYSSTSDTAGVELVSTVAGKLDSSAIETSVDGVTGIAGTAIAGGGTTYSAGQYIQISGDEISVTGINPSDYAQSSSLADYQTTAGMSGYASTSDLSAKLDVSASSSFITSTGDCMPLSASSNYASTADLSAKLDSSASSAFITSTADCMPLASSSEFYSTSNPAGYITGVDLTPYAQSSSLADYQTTAGMSAYATTGDLSAKLDASASSSFLPESASSSFLTSQTNASWSETASSSPAYIEDKPDLVDIVAGPGIVVDNPDGNTLRVSMAADYEVTLFETTSTNGYGVLNGTLSEAYTNFEYIEIYGNRTGYNANGMNLPCHDRIYTLGSPTSFHLMSMLSEGGNANTFYPSEQFTLSSTAFAFKGGANYMAGPTGMSVSVNNFNGIGVQRIVGIHRIANN